MAAGHGTEQLSKEECEHQMLEEELQLQMDLLLSSQDDDIDTTLFEEKMNTSLDELLKHDSIIEQDDVELTIKAEETLPTKTPKKNQQPKGTIENNNDMTKLHHASIYEQDDIELALNKKKKKTTTKKPIIMPSDVLELEEVVLEENLIEPMIFCLFVAALAFLPALGESPMVGQYVQALFHAKYITPMEAIVEGIRSLVSMH